MPSTGMPKVEGVGSEVHIGQCELSRLFNITDKLAQQRDDQYISSELFVLAAMDDKSSPLKADDGASRCCHAARSRRRSMTCGVEQQVNDPNAEETRQALEKLHDRS